MWNQGSWLNTSNRGHSWSPTHTTAEVFHALLFSQIFLYFVAHRFQTPSTACALSFIETVISQRALWELRCGPLLWINHFGGLLYVLAVCHNWRLKIYQRKSQLGCGNVCMRLLGPVSMWRDGWCSVSSPSSLLSWAPDPPVAARSAPTGQRRRNPRTCKCSSQCYVSSCTLWDL